MFLLVACGNTQAATAGEDQLTVNAQMIQTAEQIMALLDNTVASGDIDNAAKMFEDQYAAYGVTGAGDELKSAAEQWQGAVGDVGDYEGIVDGTVEVDGTAEEFTLSFEVSGSQRNATVEMYYNEDTVLLPQLMINPHYTFGELMKKAGLNTLLGMGTVFAVLILIMFIIMCFGIFPKIEAAKAKKAADKASSGKGVDNAIAQIIENEELSDDTEFVAVISAAIAAYEGATGGSADGFVVRSIRRANTNHWQRA